MTAFLRSKKLPFEVNLEQETSLMVDSTQIQSQPSGYPMF
jgi:hypothetical protein